MFTGNLTPPLRMDIKGKKTRLGEAFGLLSLLRDSMKFQHHEGYCI